MSKPDREPTALERDAANYNVRAIRSVVGNWPKGFRVEAHQLFLALIMRRNDLQAALDDANRRAEKAESDRDAARSAANRNGDQFMRAWTNMLEYKEESQNLKAENARLKELQKAVQAHLTYFGSCSNTEDEDPLCQDSDCTYCAMARAEAIAAHEGNADKTGGGDGR